MGNFDPNLKGRYWIGTVQKQNLLNLGINEKEFSNYEYIAETLTNIWEYSGKGRKIAGTICRSAKDLFHVHVTPYNENPTTLRSVSKVLGKSHIEPILASSKKQIEDYLLKRPPWDEKGEKVLFQFGLEKLLEPQQGKRTDLENVEMMLNNGATPEAIFRENIRYRRFEKMIINAFTDKRIAEAPLVKKMKTEWHWGGGRTGKSYEYIKLCNKYGRENIYFLTDFLNGGMDKYMEQGAPRILFIDDVKPEDLRYRQLLMLTDRYSSGQTHSRFSNAINLWDTVIVTSVYSIEAYYAQVVPEERRKVDSFDQLKGRFTTIVYHYKDNNDDYKSFSMSAEEYFTAEDMKKKALKEQYANDGVKDIPKPRELSEEEKAEYRK